MPWAQRDSSEALHLLAAARQGRTPQRRVERLALLQLLMQLHRQAHERTGEEPSPTLSGLQGQGGSAAFYGEVQRQCAFCIARDLCPAVHFACTVARPTRAWNLMKLSAIAAADAAAFTAAWCLCRDTSSLFRIYTLAQSLSEAR